MSRKKVLSTALFFISLVICLPIVGCSNKVKETYRAEMGVEIRSYWPMQEQLYYGSYSNTNADIQKKVLTNEKSELNLDIEGCPGIAVSVEFYIVNDTTGKCVKTIKVPEETVKMGLYFNYYGIKDEQGIWQETDLVYDIYDKLQTDYYNRPTTNYYQLQRKAGEHQIVFSSPYDSEYEVASEYFTLYLNFKNDKRKTVRLAAENSDTFTKYEQISNRDVFVMKNGVKSGKDFLPKIGVYANEKVIVEPALPQSFNNEMIMPHVKSFFRKTDEFYSIIGHDNSLTSYPKESGVYLASFTYTGDNIYCPIEYVCYLVIPE